MDHLKTEFSVNRVHYTAEYHDNSFSFYIDLKNSSDIYLYEYDPFEKWGTEPTKIIFDRADCDSVFTVKSHLTKFVHNSLSKFKPKYFSYSAHDDSLMSVYEKFATRIAKRYGYHFFKQGKAFTFRGFKESL